jgi:hypothetical protein
LSGGRPLPLVAKPIDIGTFPDKDILASFVGAESTHPVRGRLKAMYSGVDGYEFSCQQWVPNVTDKMLDNFIDITLRSEFCICPRGFGLSSFRLYESFQLNAIPVVVWGGKNWLPFEKFIGWGDIAVILHESEINKLGDILSSINENDRIEMRKNGRKIWEEYFRIDSFSEKILEDIKIS